MFEVKTDKRDNCEEEIFTVDYIASRIKTEIDCDETSIQGLNNNVFSLDIDAIKHEVETDNFHEHKSESEKGDDYNVSHYIKDEVDIDGESSQLSMKDFPHDIADGSAKHAQVEHDNFHGQKFAGEEEEEEDEVVEDDDNEQEEEIDDYDISNYIKDEIDIDENPFQLPMTEFPLDGSVKQVEDNHCINADAGIVAGVVKNEIDVYEEFPINIVKEEFSNEPSVDPFLPKIEPMEVYLNDNSQLYDDLEFKLFGRVAVVSAFRLEDLGTNVGSSLEAHRPNEGCEPSVEAESCNSSGERGLLLRCLREYRINETKRGVIADAIQKCRSRCSSTRGYKAQNSSQFSTHSKIHVADETHYKCDICEYKTNRKPHFTRHYRSHTGERPYKCDICNYRSINKYTLQRHIERIHFSGQNERRRYFCDQCDSTFLYLSDLKDHVRCIHEGEEDLYSCTVCDFKCNRLRRFRSHMKIHTEIKNLSCDKCSFKCSRPSKLNEHRRIHSGEKPFKCNMCQYRATRFGHLKLHMRNRHTNEKPMNRSPTSSGLSVHKKNHTTEAFTCDICGYKTIAFGHLKTHIRTHNGEKPL
ncbi:zinc finger protein 808 isoform X1 [Nilaparvata lugens]|uniref:zinc finger protein 808 isoform X1 n=1 Tax=Nilaparvata lugens TaxID=108931 RepID=UPI00193E5741|nr:zinc finger protein 808 isoform X1 [Nilaparvata lugens]